MDVKCIRVFLGIGILMVFVESSSAEGQILLEGRGLGGLVIGKSKVKDVIGEFGKPDRIETTKIADSRNYVYSKRGLKFNLYGETLNTVITLPNFGGKTSRGISLRSSLDEVRETYGYPDVAPGETINNAKVWTYPDHGVVFWLRRGWLLNRPMGIDRIVIYGRGNSKQR